MFLFPYSFLLLYVNIAHFLLSIQPFISTLKLNILTLIHLYTKVKTVTKLDENTVICLENCQLCVKKIQRLFDLFLILTLEMDK